MWRRFLALLLALLVVAQPALAYPSETLRLPPTTVNDFRFAGEVADRPTNVAGYLLEFAPRAPWLTECYGTLFDLTIWQDERPDCPASLRTVDASGNVVRHGGNTYWYTSAHNGRVELNGQYLVRSCLAHELGHVGQHRFGVLQAGHPDSTPEGRLMFAAWCSLPGPDDEESFANTVRDHLLGVTWSPFVRWFPQVLALWRPRTSYISDPIFATDGGVSFFQWWDGGRLQLERFDQYGRHLRFDPDASAWREMTT